MGLPALVRGGGGFGALGPPWGTILAIGIVEIAMPRLGGLEAQAASHADAHKAKFIVTDNALTPAETRGGFDAFRWAVYPLKRIGHPKRGGLGAGVVHARCDVSRESAHFGT